jgi:transposase
VSDVPDLPAGSGEQRVLLARLRAAVEAKDAEIGVLRLELDAERGLRRRLELRVAELERRLDQDSTDSGTPSSKEGIAAREKRKAQRWERQSSERERREDRKRGGQPGHLGKGLARDPDPDEVKKTEPPAQCRRCGAGLAGATAAEPRWAQVIDVEVIRKVTGWLLPGLECPCCAAVTFAEPSAGAHVGAVSYGNVLNAAAVVLTAYGNVPPERAAQVIAMLLGIQVSPGWVDKASARLAARLAEAGFDAAMLAALAGQDALAADETPVNVLDTNAAQPAAPDEAARDQAGEQDGAWLTALASRRKGDVAAGIPAAFTGLLMTDGYTGYQHLLSRLAGIQQCCQHSIRRCPAVMKPGPGGLQSWTGDVITVLRQAHQAVQDARGSTSVDPELLEDLRRRYDEAAAFGVTHNRHRDWHEGNHPGYALGCWLQQYKEQVFLFTRDFAMDWTTNVAERGAKAAKRHQAVSGYWHSLATLTRWCRIRSYLDSAAAHGITALDAIRAAIEGKPWLPPLPAVS